MSSISPRRTRNRTRQLLLTKSTPNTTSSLPIPTIPPISTTLLPPSLRRKQKWLLSNPLKISHAVKQSGLHIDPSSGGGEAVLVFAQEESAGTAVCIDPKGMFLTCSHCVVDEEEEDDQGEDENENGDEDDNTRTTTTATTTTTLPPPTTTHWLIFASGHAVETRCIAIDTKSDLALLELIPLQAQGEGGGDGGDGGSGVNPAAGLAKFPYLKIGAKSPKVGAELVCIGHPGSEDLEVDKPGVKTGYDVLHVSTGTYHGCFQGQDPLDNSEIGALMHDCWTYWGHSGAPIIELGTGSIIGLHSSWDEDTGMRRGVPLVAIKKFLAQYAFGEDLTS